MGAEEHAEGRPAAQGGEPVVSLAQIAGLLRRHLLAVLVVFIVAAGAYYGFKHAPPAYAETGTFTFLPPHSGVHPNPYEAVGGSLTNTAGAIAVESMSPQDEQRVLASGGTASYDVELVNSYNLEYPNYSLPYLTVTTTSTDLPAVHQTFTVLTRLLTQQLQQQQLETFGVTKNNLAEMTLSGDTGPLIQQGSPKRILFGLVILTIIAVFAVASFLDRHPVSLRRGGRRIRLGRAARRPGLSGADRPVTW
jgi:hypothetical protein